MLLKDSSVISGHVILNTDKEVRVIILNGDTINIGQEYVDQVITKKLYKDQYKYKDFAPRHKTEGIFINAEPVANPFAISVGKRINSHWNIGGTIFYGGVRSNNFGIAPYVRYYVGNKLFSHRLFFDSFVGVSQRSGNTSFFSRSLNKYPLTGSVAVGVQIPSRLPIRFYFKIGGFFNYDKGEFVRASSPFPNIPSSSELVSENGIVGTLQVSLIAIQF